jgi:hypothetical protein
MNLRTLRVAALALLCALAWAAESATASAELSAGVPVLRIGDAAALTLRYRWPAGTELLSLADPTLLFDGEQMLQLGPMQELRAGGSIERRWRLALLARSSGDWVLERPRLVLREQGRTVELLGDAVVLRVVSSGATTALELPAPAGLLASPRRVSPWWWLLAPAVVLALGGGAWWFLARRQLRPAVQPEESFALALASVPAAPDPATGAAVLAKALRAYCAAIFAIHAQAMTARELDRALRPQLPQERLRALTRLVERLEGLRWAPRDLEAATLKPLVDGARDWVLADTQRRHEAAETARRTGTGTGVSP